MKKTEIDELEKRFPSKEVALEFISELKNLNLADIDLRDLAEKIDNVFHIIPFGHGYIDKRAKLFRARPNEVNQVFSNVSDIGINKPERIKKFGRANRPNEAVFYCATNEHLALGEVLQFVKDTDNPKNEICTATLSVWETNNVLHVSPVYYSEAVTKVREDVHQYKNGNKASVREGGIISHETLDVNDLIVEFFCDEFSKEKILSHDDYKFSAFYANRLRLVNDLLAPEHYHQKFDGLIYPSVALKYIGDNIALFDDHISTKVQFKTAFQVVCTNFDVISGNFQTTVTHRVDSVDDDGNLTWIKV